MQPQFPLHLLEQLVLVVDLVHESAVSAKDGEATLSSFTSSSGAIGTSGLSFDSDAGGFK